MSQSPRLSAILPLKIMLSTDSRTYFAHTLDISVSGARVILPMALEVGHQLVLEYKKNRARAVVVWSKPVKRGAADHVIGMRLLDDGQRFWLVDLGPKAYVMESNGRSESMHVPKARQDRTAV